MAKEKKFIVKVTRVQGIGKKTFTAGETVSENDFPAGNAELLMKGGYISLIEEKKEEAKEEKKESKKVKE